MKSIEHTAGRCSLCDSRLKSNLHVMMVAWFYHLKKKYPFLHLWDDPNHLEFKLFQIDEDGNDRICESFFEKIKKELKTSKISEIKNKDINTFYYSPKGK